MFDGVWSVRLAVVGGAIGVLLVAGYYGLGGYVNPIVGVLFYAIVGAGIGAGIDWALRQRRRRR